MSKLERLAAKHPYYCYAGDWYGNGNDQCWATASDYLDSMENSDVDLNLVFRFDVEVRTGRGYAAKVFIMQQRKGVFKPHWIETITKDECDRFEAYLKKHWEKLQEMWRPVNENIA